MVAEAIGNPLYVIRKPIHAPFEYYRENAAGYTTLAEAWRVTEEIGRRYISGRPHDSDRVVMELAPTPSFSTSRDACATFEATITDRRTYNMNLEEAVRESFQDWRIMDPEERFFEVITATPRQRCIAFLRMKGVL